MPPHRRLDQVLITRKTGLEVESHLAAGSLVPDDTILKLILSELEAKSWVLPKRAAQPLPAGFAVSISRGSTTIETATTATSEDPTASFILDGFPRTAPQAAMLAPHLPINLCVALETPASIILDRIAKRWVHAPSGRVYNVDFNPPQTLGKDDVTGEPLSKRPDDTEEVWRTRLQKFHETSQPLLEFYERKGVLWTVKGNSSDEISPKLFDEFARRFG